MRTWGAAVLRPYNIVPRRVGTTRRLGLGELGVAFDEFFGAAAGEGDGEFAVVFVAFDGDDGADAVFGVADFLAEHGVGGGGFFAEGEG